MERQKVLSEESYNRLIAAVEEKYGTQACDLEPLHAMLYYVSEETIKECMKADWCDDFLKRLSHSLNTVL